MTTQDRTELIEQAQELVSQAQTLVDEAISGTSQENNYRAYGEFGFSQLLGNGNPYDGSLDTLLEGLDAEEDDE